MLNDIYQEVKSALQAITGSYPVEWFNMQYEGVIIHENGFFVEFPEALLFDQLTKDIRRTPIKIRVHVYSKVINTADGIADADVAAHEEIALEALDALDKQELIKTTTIPPVVEGGQPTYTYETLCTRLQFRGWQHWHKWKGWMVTYVDFECKKVF
jgi:hypothetical protein